MRMRLCRRLVSTTVHPLTLPFSLPARWHRCRLSVYRLVLVWRKFPFQSSLIGDAICCCWNSYYFRWMHYYYRWRSCHAVVMSLAWRHLLTATVRSLVMYAMSKYLQKNKKTKKNHKINGRKMEKVLVNPKWCIKRAAATQQDNIVV